MSDLRKAYVYAGITVMMWATVATAFKIALASLNTIQLLMVANATSWVIFLIIILVGRKVFILRNTTLKELALSALQGLLNPFAYYLILFEAYSLLPAQVAQPANFIWPIVLMLLSVPILGHTLSWRAVVALLISFSGVLVLASQGQFQHFRIINPVGMSLCLVSSLLWSFFWILNMKDQRDALIKLFLSFSFSMVYIFILAGITGNLKPIEPLSLAPAIYIGLFEMGLSFVFWLKALQYSGSTSKIAILIYLTPFLSLIFIHFILGERLLITSFIGLCLIVAGIAASSLKKQTV
jgi:drug/metabolite transporter (DMT)-like permease